MVSLYRGSFSFLLLLEHGNSFVIARMSLLSKGSLNRGSTVFNRPNTIYQYSHMTLRLLGQTSLFGVVFFVSKLALLGIERQKRLLILTGKPRSDVRILIERGLL